MKTEIPCPHCGKSVAISVAQPDPIETEGYDATKRNALRTEGPYENNPYTRGTREFYRWNRNYWRAQA